MKLKIISILSMILLFGIGTSHACYVLNKREARVVLSKGFRGECSNNGSTITCLLEEGSWVKCSGPKGSVSGIHLDALIYSVCECAADEEERRQLELEEQMSDY